MDRFYSGELSVQTRSQIFDYYSRLTLPRSCQINTLVTSINRQLPWVNTRYLKQLSANLGWSNSLKKVDLFYLVKLSKQNAHQLERLNIKVGCLRYFSQGDVRVLSHKIRNLKNLKRLRLTTDLGSLSAHSLYRLANSLTTLPRLQQLALEFNNSGNESSDYGLRYLFQQLQSNHVLQSLELKLSNIHLDHHLFKAFNRLKASNQCLTRLVLKTAQCQIDDLALIQLAARIADWPNLQVLSLAITNNHITPQHELSEIGITWLFRALAACTNLIGLNLQLDSNASNCSIAMRHLSKSLTKLSKLQRFELNCGAMPMTSDWDLIQLALGLKKCTDLDSLHLNFNRCEQVSEIGFQYLAKACSTSLRQARYCRLSFASCQGFNDNCFKSWLEPLTNANVEHLALSFANCQFLSHKCWSFLGRVLSTLDQLRCLSLDFNNCPGLLHDNIKQFINTVEELANLEHLTLSLTGFNVEKVQAGKLRNYLGQRLINV